MQAVEKHKKFDILGQELESIDWSFADRDRSDEIESLHPYPAKFIPDIPRAFLSVLPVPAGTAVLDPFCGSGTSLVEAQRLGLPSVGIDLNPIASLISRVKTGRMPVGLNKAATEVAQTAMDTRDPVRWEIPNVDHWFKPEIQEVIAALVHAIRKYPNKNFEDALSLALSSILVRISNQESDTRYAAIEKKVTRNDVFSYFLAACSKISRALSSRAWELTSAKVIEGDALKVSPETIGIPVGMVITSPPYPNAYEYWLYHKYRMWWLGYDPLMVKSQEIGARAHFFKRDPHTEENFWTQMRSAMDLIDSVLVENGFICFVVGRSKIHGQIINNADIVQSISKEYGMDMVARFDRVISASRKSFNLSHANIKVETVLVLQKRESN